MATEHGAGLMLIPLIHGKPFSALPQGISVVAVHTAGYVLATTAIAFAMYETMHLTLLRKGWVNFDLIWAISLLITAAFLMLNCFF